MVKENGLLWEVTFWEFFWITVVLAGGLSHRPRSRAFVE